MATRILPGAYVSLNDLSYFPEGMNSLTVGYVLQCDRGEVNKPMLVTSPTDFLTKTTLNGYPDISADPTFWSILKVLARTNQVYVVRAANNPLYGGIILKEDHTYGEVIRAYRGSQTFIMEGEAPENGKQITVTGSNLPIDGNYFVDSSVGVPYNLNAVFVADGALQEDFGASIRTTVETSITAEPNDEDGTTKLTFNASMAPAAFSGISIAETGVIDGDYSVVDTAINEDVVEVTVNALLEAYTSTTGNPARVDFEIGTVDSAIGGEKTFYIFGEMDIPNDIHITVFGTLMDGEYTVVSTEKRENRTLVEVAEDFEGDFLSRRGQMISTPVAYLDDIEDPEGVAQGMGNDELLLITGKNPGEYNGELAYKVVSSVDNPDALAYPNTMELTVINANTNTVLETFVFSRDTGAKELDGTSLYVEDVVKGSSYIQVFNNNNVPSDRLPVSIVDPVRSGRGSAGKGVDENTLVAALEAFADKTVPVSIIGNGCSTAAESTMFQQALLELADTRKDIVVFLNSRYEDERATLNSEKAQNVVAYKKNELGSTSFYGCMYAPHVNSSDTFNNRTIRIGTDAIAIAGWLNVINNLNYPYAYAGPQNGLVTGVTCDWKIGDTSGEAELLNDASINFVAFDGKVGRYYMQCQNTLQIANSSLRNIGCVLNVLDIKETLGTTLKEYCNLPITDVLRRDILNSVNDYLSPMLGTRFYNYSFQDVTTEADIAQDTLRYLLTISLTRYAAKLYCAINVVGPNYDFSLLQSV